MAISNDGMDFNKLTLVAACGMSCSLTSRAMTPPHLLTETPNVQDRVGKYASGERQTTRRVFLMTASLYHATIVLSQPLSSKLLCPYPQNLNTPLLFQWSPYIAGWLCALCLVGVPVRLLAFRALGNNFTFRLNKPSSLTTTGMYRYVQHPSYTGQMIILAAHLALFLRWDGVMGCWISPRFYRSLVGWGPIVLSFLAVLIALGFRVRVMDEEKMLKDKVGDEWVEWHSRTKRFIPFVF